MIMNDYGHTITMKRIDKLNSSHECAMHKRQKKNGGTRNINREQQKSKQIKRNCDCKWEYTHRGQDERHWAFLLFRQTLVLNGMVNLIGQNKKKKGKKKGKNRNLRLVLEGEKMFELLL